MYDDDASARQRTRRRTWILAIIAAILLATHGVVLRFASSHFMLSGGLVSGIVLLLLIKLSFLGPVHALFRHKTRKR